MWGKHARNVNLSSISLRTLDRDSVGEGIELLAYNSEHWCQLLGLRWRQVRNRTGVFLYCLAL